MKKIKLRFLSALMAVMLCVTAFSVPALAYGGGETTGGLEPETKETGTADTTGGTDADNADTTDGTDAETKAAALTDEEIAEILASLFGSQVSVTTTDDGIKITTGDSEKAAPHQTGTVTTGGGRLNVRTGAGLDNTAFTQLANGTQVEVIGTDGDWIQVLLPERTGYVHSDYLTVSDTASASGNGFSLSIGEEELSTLLELFSGSAALTPDGNLSLIDDIGSATGSGKQFLTVETKTGNFFYLIIDRDDKGEETVHFLNQVDEADLLTLMEGSDGGETPAACTCKDKCVAGAVNTGCPVCATNMTECAGKEPEPAEPAPADDADAEPEPETSGGAAGGILIVLLLAALVGGGAYGYIKFIRKKPKTKTSPDPDDYDFDDEDEDETDALDTDYETEVGDEDSAESEDE